MKSFNEMKLAYELESALDKIGFKNPTKIQEAVIPISMQGQDIIACAETGSGKTGAYGIPLVSKLLQDEHISSLVLAPTRELAQQIADFFREITVNCKGVGVVTLVGGADIRKQLKQLKKNPRIVVATPGRLTDHLKRRSLSLKTTEILVLDEGDRMLDMGFAPQLDVILKYLPKERQTSLFSATLPDKVKQLAKKYLNNPKHISIGATSMPVSSIKQSFVDVKAKEKNNKLIDELKDRDGSIIIFARTKRRTDSLAKFLVGYGVKVDIIHGGKSQGQRNKAIQNFKKGKSRVLCATDVAARGIDIPIVEHVINFDLPMFTEDYVHRIGRTARNGAKGEAVSFVTPEEQDVLQDLARKYKIKGIEIKVVPRGRKSFGKKKSSSGKKFSSKKSSGKKFSGKKSSSKKSSGKKFSSKKSSGKKFSSKKSGKKTSNFKGKKSSGPKRNKRVRARA